MLNIFLIFAVFYIIIALAQSIETSCQSSAAIEIVDSCPQTVVEWKQAVGRKNCETISHTCPTFDYHCVINTWMNETIEVCAPRVLIVGQVCAEFYLGGNRIQRNEYAKCEKCPQFYNSSAAFKYTECYEYVARSKGVDTPQSTTESPNSSTCAYSKSTDRNDEISRTQGQSNHTKNKSRVVIGLSVLAVVVIVAIVSSILLSVLRWRMRHRETRTIHRCSSVKNVLLSCCSVTCKTRQGHSQYQVSEIDNLTAAG